MSMCQNNWKIMFCNIVNTIIISLSLLKIQICIYVKDKNLTIQINKKYYSRIMITYYALI